MDLDVVVKIYARLPPGGGVVKGGGFGKVLQGKATPRPRSNPLSFHIPFLTKKVTLSSSNRRGVLRSGGGGGVTSQ